MRPCCMPLHSESFRRRMAPSRCFPRRLVPRWLWWGSQGGMSLRHPHLSAGCASTSRLRTSWPPWRLASLRRWAGKSPGGMTVLTSSLLLRDLKAMRGLWKFSATRTRGSFGRMRIGRTSECSRTRAERPSSSRGAVLRSVRRSRWRSRMRPAGAGSLEMLSLRRDAWSARARRYSPRRHLAMPRPSAPSWPLAFAPSAAKCCFSRETHRRRSSEGGGLDRDEAATRSRDPPPRRQVDGKLLTV